MSIQVRALTSTIVALMAGFAAVSPTKSFGASLCELVFESEGRPEGYPTIPELRAKGYRVVGIVDDPEGLKLIREGGPHIIVAGGALPPLINGEFPYILVRGTMNPVYFYKGQIWWGGKRQPGSYVLDNRNRLFTTAGIPHEVTEAGWRYYPETEVSALMTAWYPGLGVSAEGYLVYHGVRYPKAGAGFSVLPLSGDVRDRVGILGGDLYQNGQPVNYLTTPIIIDGKKIPHSLENLDIWGGGSSNMDPGF